MTSICIAVLSVGVMALGLGFLLGRVSSRSRRDPINLTLGGSTRYSRDEVRELIDKISEVINDGMGSFPR